MIDLSEKMSKNRGEKLEYEMSTLEDAILYAESIGEKELEEAKVLLKKVKKFFDQGTWSMAERELLKVDEIKNSHWYREFIEKREGEGSKTEEQKRFVGDGLCRKYGHIMVQIRLSNVRWYYQCRLCKKRGKSGSIK